MTAEWEFSAGRYRGLVSQPYVSAVLRQSEARTGLTLREESASCMESLAGRSLSELTYSLVLGHTWGWRGVGWSVGQLPRVLSAVTHRYLLSLRTNLWSALTPDPGLFLRLASSFSAMSCLGDSAGLPDLAGDGAVSSAPAVAEPAG